MDARMKDNCWEFPFMVAVRTADCEPVGIVPAVTEKVAAEDPAATVTEAGTLSVALLLESDTVAAEGAGWLKVTVQVEELPETKEVTSQASDVSRAGVTSEMEAVCEELFQVAVTTAV